MNPTSPAPGERVGRLLRLLPVARHDLRPAGDELPDLAGRHVAAGVVDDAHERVEHRNADRQRARARIDRGAAVQRDGVRR
jgi:hypothetical protein